MKKKNYEKPQVTPLGDVVEQTLGDGRSEMQEPDGYVAVWIGMVNSDSTCGIRLRPKPKPKR